MANLPIFDLFNNQIMDPKYNRQNLTNRVLIKSFKDQSTDNKSDKKLTTFYIPAYLRAKIKNFSQMSLSDLSATINLVFILTLNFKGIPEFLQQQIRKKLVLRFNRDEPVRIGQETQQVTVKKDEQGVYTFTIRKLLNAGMKADIFFTPFEMIYLILSIKIQKINLDKSIIYEMINERKRQIVERKEDIKPNSKQGELSKDEVAENMIIDNEINDIKRQIQILKSFKQIFIEFNLMDFQADPYLKIAYSEKGTFGEYDLAEKKLKVQYTNFDLAPKIREQLNVQTLKGNGDFSKVSSFEFAHFQIPLYKFPTVTLLTIFIPLWLLGILNLGVFFQDTQLSDRIGSLSALMIAFVALIPVIREALPPNPNITLVQIFVYLETTTTLFCFIQSIQVRGSETYQFVWNQNGFFLISVAIGIAEVIIIMFIYLVDKFYWQKSYNLHVDDTDKSQFDFRQWYNPECDKHFRRKLDTGQIKILNAIQFEESQQNKKKQQLKLLEDSKNKNKQQDKNEQKKDDSKNKNKQQSKNEQKPEKQKRNNKQSDKNQQKVEKQKNKNKQTA